MYLRLVAGGPALGADAGPMTRTFRGSSVVVGSAPGCEFRLQHPSVVGRHVCIERRGDQWFASAPEAGKLRVDGQQLAPGQPATECWPGSMLEVGEFDLTIELTDEAPAEPAAPGPVAAPPLPVPPPPAPHMEAPPPSRMQRAPPTAIPSLLPPAPSFEPPRSAPPAAGETGTPSIVPAGPATCPTLAYQGIEGARTLSFAGRPISVGRGSTCDLRLGVDGDKVSRTHTVFEWDGNAVWVTDKSANGTFVDNMKVEGRIRVAPGQRVWITRFRRPDGQWDSEHVVAIVPPGGTAVAAAVPAAPGPATRVFRKDAPAAAPPPAAAPVEAAPAAPPPWERVANVRLLEHFAQSPYGSVYRGEQELSGGLKRKVLVKVFHQLEGKGKEAARKKFLGEAGTFLELAHPGIVRILDVGEHDELPYMVMEHLTTTLAARMKEGPMPADRIRELVRQAAAALSALHEHPRRILHRDIKGESLWLDEFGNVRLSDFGLAKFVEHDPTMKPGTFRYTPPELFNPAGGNVGPAADLYSLGYLVYEAALGEAAFQAEFADIYRNRGREESGWMTWHTTGTREPRSLSTVIPGFPEDLSRLIGSMTARSISARPADARAVAAILSGAPAVAAPAAATMLSKPPPASRPGGEALAHRATMVVSRGEVAAAIRGKSPAAAPEPVHAPPAAPTPVPQSVDPAAVPVVGPSATEEHYEPPPEKVRTVIPQSDSGPVADAERKAGGGSSLGMYLIGGAAVLAIGLGLAWFFLRGRGGTGETKDADKKDVVDPKQQPPASTDWTTAESFDNSMGMKFARIKAGQFLMGSPRDEADRDANEMDPVNKTVGDLHMLTVEVSQGWFRLFKKEHSQGGNDPELPAVGVNFADAERFCKWLGEQAEEKKAGRAYRLPTEAEWEYACRAGTTGPFAGEVDALAWHRGNSNGRIQQTARKKANAWGLFDMHGNAREWCSEAGSQPESRVTRGGSFDSPAYRCRSAARVSEVENQRLPDLGFRVVCVPGR